MPDPTPTEPPEGVPGDRLDRLFHGPLEEFTPARNELAKSLRPDDAAASDWVKGLRKPSRAAWLVNQLAARKPDDVERLLEAGRELRAAQEEMLAGSPDRERLRDAARREQVAIDSLVGTAEALGREHGVGAQVLTRVGETLQAASGAPEVAEAVKRGRLTREQRSASVGLVGAVTPAAPKGRGAAAKEREAAERRASQQRKQAERKLASAEKRLERERAALERARGAVEDAERRVHDAERERREAQRALDDI